MLRSAWPPVWVPALGLSGRLARSGAESPSRPRALVPAPVMWLPRARGLARAELGKRFVRKNIASRYFCMFPRTNPPLQPTPTPNTVSCWGKAFWIEIGFLDCVNNQTGPDMESAALMRAARRGLLLIPGRSFSERRNGCLLMNVVRPQVSCRGDSRKRK